MAIIINGQELSKQIRIEIKEEVRLFENKYKRAPGLAVVLVGNDPASQIYVRNKSRACEECGIYSEVITFEENTEEKELLQKIEELNKKEKIDGILVQLPLPKHISSKKVIESISISKDVDVFHPTNIGRLTEGNSILAPCTPAGIIEMLKRYHIEMEGQKCVIVGRSNIVGKPLALLLTEENATVTLCHSKTRNLTEECKSADILIASVGKAHFIKENMVKDGAVVIDVGMNRNEEGKLCGDVDFENVEKKASFITPVPKGVGPMTITMLMKNTVTVANKRKETEERNIKD